MVCELQVNVCLTLADAKEIAPLVAPNVGLREAATDDFEVEQEQAHESSFDEPEPVRESRSAKSKSKPKKVDPYAESTSPAILALVGAAILLAIVGYWVSLGSSKKAQ
jgi:hypothetical protein